MDVGRIPPVLYAVDVRYDDGRCLCGVTVPGNPHVQAGRNDHVAWAYTFGHADNIDVTVERVEGDTVRVADRIEPLTREVEEVRVRGVGVERWVFRRLPTGVAVLGTGDGDHPAMRWRGLEDAVSDHVTLRGILDARDVDELVALHREVRTLSTAAVFGDASGRIAWMHCGVIPRDRAGWGPRRRGADDPLLDEALRPVVVDPPEGLVGSANEHVEGWTAFPEPSYRKQRLMERLRSRPVWDLESASRVTHDEHDPCAERLMAAWAPLLPELAEARSLATWAAGQDRIDPETSRRYRLRFHRLHLEATRALLAELVGRDAADLVLDGLGLHLVLQPAADDLLAGEGPTPLATDALRRILASAWGAASWDWSGPSSAIDAAPFENALEGGMLPRFLGMSTPPIRMPGGPTSLFQTRQVPFLGEVIVGGPAFRLVMDLGRPGARYMMAGGASERRFGPGYAKGLDAWAEGRLAPLGPQTPADAPRPRAMPAPGVASAADAAPTKSEAPAPPVASEPPAAPKRKRSAGGRSRRKAAPPEA
jgi:penicillin amidase